MAAIDLSHWTEKTPMPLPRAGCGVAAWNGKLVVAGGTYWTPEKKIWTERADAFTPGTNQWEALPPLPRPHGDAACLVLGDAIVVFGGGSDGSTETTAWSFRRGLWQPEPGMTLPAPRKSPASALIGGTAYAIGGFERPNDMNSATRTVWALEPGAKGWEERAPLPGPARFNPATATVGGRIFLAGGASMDSGKLENLDDIVAYDPKTDRWSAQGRLPFANRAASGVEFGGKLLVIGGYSDQFERRISAFDPTTGAVAPAGDLPHGLADSRFVRLGERILGVGGENGVKMRAPWTIEARP